MLRGLSSGRQKGRQLSCGPRDLRSPPLGPGRRLFRCSWGSRMGRGCWQPFCFLSWPGRRCMGVCVVCAVGVRVGVGAASGTPCSLLRPTKAPTRTSLEIWVDMPLVCTTSHTLRVSKTRSGQRLVTAAQMLGLCLLPGDSAGAGGAGSPLHFFRQFVAPPGDGVSNSTQVSAWLQRVLSPRSTGRFISELFKIDVWGLSLTD